MLGLNTTKELVLRIGKLHVNSAGVLSKDQRNKIAKKKYEADGGNWSSLSEKEKANWRFYYTGRD